MIRNRNALVLAHDEIEKHVKEGDICIDATAGRGQDSCFLAGLVGEGGKVIAMDIQEEAIGSTRLLLTSHKLIDRVELVLDSHVNMGQYASLAEVDCITFNFGWLPGGDHSIQTQGETSIQAIEEGLKLLRSGGLMSLILYYGGDSGFKEKDMVLDYLSSIDFKKYTVISTQFFNRPNNPPIPLFIYKH